MAKKEKNPVHLLNQLVECLGKASGAAGQIIHQHQDPRWRVIRDCTQLAKEGCIHLATFSTTRTIVTKQG